MANLLQTLMNAVNAREEEVIVNADSKGFILDYIGFKTTNPKAPQGIYGRKPRFNPSEVLKIVRNDPVVRAAVITLVDKVVESGWRVQGKDKKSREAALIETLKELRFNQLLRKIVFNLVLYNNAFVEIRKRGGKVVALNLLETEHMRISAEDNGDIIEYYQEVGTNNRDRPTWSPEEVVHFKLDDFTTNVWSELNVEALYETILIKDYIRQWIQWFYATNQSRPLISIENASGTKVKEFMAYLKAAEQHVGKPIPVEGKIVVDKLQSMSDEGATVMQFLTWCDEQIMMLLQVPPLAVGKSDLSGRSDGAEQRLYLHTRVFNIHKLLEDEITYDLFPKMDFKKADFVFGILDETVRTRVFETVQLMRNSQFTEDAILEYLESQGVTFETDKVLVSREELMQMSNKELGTGNEGMKGNESADAAQSRQRQNSDDLSKKNRQVKE